MNGLIRLEDAIKAINDAPCHSESIRAIFRCAISALEQEPCEDAISRDAVINMLEGMIKDRQVYFGHHGDIEYSCGFSTFKWYVEQLPSVTQKSAECDDAISRQAAIDVLDRWLSCDDYNESERHIMRATESILYDLPPVTQKPIECDDAISREDRIKDLIGAIENDDCNYWTPTKIASALKQLPSVTQKSGKWIFVDKAKEHAHCSECDYGNVDLFDGRPHNYCQNCGAKMESEDKE